MFRATIFRASRRFAFARKSTSTLFPSAGAARFVPPSGIVVGGAKALGTLALASFGLGCTTVAIADSKDANNYNITEVRAAIEELVESTGMGPTIVRLAWHAAGTYDKNTKTGGSNGATMRFKPESDHGANAGLHLARRVLEPIKARFPAISYSDLWTLAGCVAIEAMGGPAISWRGGRTDAADGSVCPESGRLPDSDGRGKSPAEHTRDIFYRQGFNDKEIVALLGAHALGRCHTDRSGHEGPWTRAPTTFSNEFFRLLIEETWTVRKWNGPMQYENKQKDLMMLPTDMALLSDPEFRKHVDVYSKNEDAFFKDFAAAFKKLMENGCTFPKTGLRAWLPW